MISANQDGKTKPAFRLSALIRDHRHRLRIKPRLFVNGTILENPTPPLTFEAAGCSIAKTIEGMGDQFQFDVFLGHSAKDKAVVRELAARLQRDGVRVWLGEANPVAPVSDRRGKAQRSQSTVTTASIL